ncbi:MAG: ATP synthase F1 subunit epsilon, partial [Reyranella sp.]|jgi:F-type H+-transporting ATPase subunit epsilon|nr:ATP synthase F1 subunit epsilon [Reyranella sp.]
MPERELLATEADMVVVPGSEGDFGVLPGHAPLVSTVRPGVLEVYQGSKVERRFLVAGGFAEVTPERCTVLADEAVPFEQVTVAQLDERERSARNDITDAATPAEKAAAEKNLGIAQDLKRAQAFYASR